MYIFCIQLTYSFDIIPCFIFWNSSLLCRSTLDYTIKFYITKLRLHFIKQNWFKQKHFPMGSHRITQEMEHFIKCCVMIFRYVQVCWNTHCKTECFWYKEENTNMPQWPPSLNWNTEKWLCMIVVRRSFIIKKTERWFYLRRCIICKVNEIKTSRRAYMHNLTCIFM